VSRSVAVCFCDSSVELRQCTAHERPHHRSASISHLIRQLVSPSLMCIFGQTRRFNGGCNEPVSLQPRSIIETCVFVFIYLLHQCT